MKLLFDENISRPATCALQALIAATEEEAEGCHLLERCPMGAPDSDWLSQFQDQSHPWLVVTADSAKRRGGDRLPEICKDLRIRHVLISGKLHQRKQFDKMRAILTVWPDLREAFKSESGSRFKLQQAKESFILKAA